MIWERIDNGVARGLGEKIIYKGELICAEDKEANRVKKWLIRNGFKITGSKFIDKNINEDIYITKDIAFYVSKDGIYRKIDIPQSKEARQLYLPLFKKYFEVLKENMELKNKQGGI